VKCWLPRFRRPRRSGLTIARKDLAAGLEEDHALTADCDAADQGWGMRGFTILLRCEEGANAIELALVAR
jgi:hypothetical protein